MEPPWPRTVKGTLSPAPLPQEPVQTLQQKEPHVGNPANQLWVGGEASEMQEVQRVIVLQ